MAAVGEGVQARARGIGGRARGARQAAHLPGEHTERGGPTEPRQLSADRVPQHRAALRPPEYTGDAMPDTGPPWIEPTSAGINIRVYVAPRASANKVVGVHNGAIKISLTAPPVDGAANKALLEFLAGVLGVPRSSL